MKKRKVIAILVVSLLVLALGVMGVWLAVFVESVGPSVHNYDQVAKGMEYEQVIALLGPGEEVKHDQIPGVPPYAKFPDAPEGELGVVWGDRFFRWRDGEHTILIGFSGGRVLSKHRWWEHAW